MSITRLELTRARYLRQPSRSALAAQAQGVRPHASSLIGTMSRITLEQLTAFIDRHRPGAGDSVDLVVLTAQNVVAEYLGPDWVLRYLRGPEGAYFRAVSQGPKDGFLYHDRVLSLAEILLNLQDTPGIDDVLRRLKAGEIEPAVAELEAAYFLDLCQLPFRFHARQFKQGCDYDLEVDLPGHGHLPCEGKCKLEDTRLTCASVKQTLESARKQLPKNSSGIIILTHFPHISPGLSSN